MSRVQSWIASAIPPSVHQCLTNDVSLVELADAIHESSLCVVEMRLEEGGGG